MNPLAKLISISFLLLFVGACASTPTWEGMSESEIAAWQQLGYDAGAAHTFQKAGLSTTDAEGWHSSGITSSEAILTWHGKGFASDEAAKWIQHQFSVAGAESWKKEKFTPDEAGKWKSAGFSLKDAIKNREKGLQPIR